MCNSVHDGVYHTPLGEVSKLDCSTDKRVPIPNDASSESSLTDASNAHVVATGTIPTAVEISIMENRPRGGWCDKHPSYTVRRSCRIMQNSNISALKKFYVTSVRAAACCTHFLPFAFLTQPLLQLPGLFTASTNHISSIISRQWFPSLLPK